MILAITGMDVFFAGCTRLDAFERCIYEGIQIGGRITPEWRDESKLLRKVVKGALSDANSFNSPEPLIKTALLSALGCGQVPGQSTNRREPGIDR